ncbi:MAG: hypothetical protein ACRCSF_01910 [Mycobacteriaceae bacterium]
MTNKADLTLVNETAKLRRIDGTKPAIDVLAKTADARIVRLGFQSGQGLSEHKTTTRLLLHVTVGEVILQVGDAEPVTLSVNCQAMLAAKVPHSVFAYSDAVLILTVLASS